MPPEGYPRTPEGRNLLYGLRNGSGGHSAKQEPKNERLARAEELLPSPGKFTFAYRAAYGQSTRSL
jgi:hypothetical protein